MTRPSAGLSTSAFAGVRRSGWPRFHLTFIVAVFIGGCAGGLSRYAVTEAWPTPTYGFPWATFTVNVTGACLLAVLLVVVIDLLPPTTYARPLLGTGFLGAWTTFSSITTTAEQLIAHGHPATGAVYLVASMIAGLVAGAFGLIIGRALGAHRRRARHVGST